MTKQRLPGSVEDALDQAIGFVGAPTLAEWIGKSESLVRKYANPDDDERRLTVADALSIDARLAILGHPQVFATLFAERAERNGTAESASEPRAERPLPHATRLVRAAAKLTDDIVAAESDGIVDRAEARDLLTAMDRLQRHWTPLRKALYAQSKSRPHPPRSEGAR